MDMVNIGNQMLILFVIMAIGYLAGKLKILSEQGNKVLSSLVMQITLPCTILDSVLNESIHITGGSAIRFLLVAVACYAIMIIIALVVPKLLRIPKEDAGVYKFVTVFSNTGFMGYPVTEAIFGPASALYVSMLGLVFNPLAFSVGASFIRGGKGKFNFRVLITPTMITTLLAVVIVLAKIPFPYVICRTVDMVGTLTTPVSMIVIGASLSFLPLRQVFGEWRMYALSGIRLILIPILLWFFMGPLVPDPLMRGVLTILLGMPGASMTTMMCFEHGGNTRLASQAVFITTLVSFLTIPFLVWLLLA